MRNLVDFTAELLSYAGALVEKVEGGLEVLLPNEAAGALEIPEHVRLTLSPEDKRGILLSYDSELFKKMGGLLAEEGRFAVVTLPPLPLRLEKLEDRLAEKILLQNAVFDLTRKEEGPISYLLGYFRYTARSDERQEGIIATLINERNLSVRPFQAEWLDLLDAAEGPTEVESSAVSEPVLNALLRAEAEMAREALCDFIKSLERRLHRDITRVHGYYQTLIEEAMRIAAKKAADGPEKGMAISSLENGAATRSSESEKAESKIAAIETERRWKVQDLIAKYRLTLQTEPVCLIRIETKGPIFWLTLKRRKGKRFFPLTYNPIVKALDPLPCEGCFHPKKVSFVCDDRLHLLCPPCFSPCLPAAKSIAAPAIREGAPNAGQGRGDHEEKPLTSSAIGVIQQRGKSNDTVSRG